MAVLQKNFLKALNDFSVRELILELNPELKNFDSAPPVTELFLIYPHISAHSFDALDFFKDKLGLLDHEIEGQPVFFSEKNALSYTRFSQVSSIILRAYVPERAIQACFSDILVKPGYLSRSCIHGAYFPFEDSMDYCKNPNFASFLKQYIKKPS